MKLNKQEKMYKKPIEVTDTVENRSFSLLRLLGYILLVFALIDYIAIIIPVRLTDPSLGISDHWATSRSCMVAFIGDCICLFLHTKSLNWSKRNTSFTMLILGFSNSRVIIHPHVAFRD